MQNIDMDSISTWYHTRTHKYLLIKRDLPSSSNQYPRSKTTKCRTLIISDHSYMVIFTLRLTMQIDNLHPDTQLNVWASPNFSLNHMPKLKAWSKQGINIWYAHCSSIVYNRLNRTTNPYQFSNKMWRSHLQHPLLPAALHHDQGLQMQCGQTCR